MALGGSCPLCLSIKIFLNRHGGLNETEANFAKTWRGGNNLTPPGGGFWGIFPSKFPLNEYKYPNCMVRKIGEGFIPFKLENGRGIHTGVVRNSTA